MKILKLEAANVKRLRAIEISPDPAQPLVIIRGDNAQGKSSVLDSIAMALGGKALQPPRPVRDGEDEAHVVLELDDLVVTRRWSSNEKSVLEVKEKDGLPQKAPQAILDRLVGKLSFDPLSFLRLEPKQQLETVRVALGLDFSKLEVTRANAYAERTITNRELERARAQVAALPKEKAPEWVDTMKLLAEQERLLQVQRASTAASAAENQAGAAVVAAVRDYKACEERVKRAREALDQEERLLQRLAEAGQAARAAHEAAKKTAAEAEDVDLDLLTIRDRLAAAEATNAAARKLEERKKLVDQVAELEAQSAAFSKTITQVDQAKADQLEAAKFPVPGLTFAEGGVLLNGVPFEQSSQAEQLRVSVALGIAGNPKLRVLLVRDGSLLDKKSLKLLGELAAAADCQVWCEMVGTDGAGIVIEDGGVASFS